ncbi:MAG: hypothetical protein PHX54_13500 [Lentimicrobiaceae bacterium]|nr:hypothetical protein [Lentimicrobiaceae bacterium]
MRTLMILGFILLNLAGFSQKYSAAETEGNYIEMARAELNSALSQQDSKLNKAISEAGISGNYVFDISIRGKGEVSTVFIVNTGSQSIKMQNALKDIIKAYRFSFKLPKGKSYKFQFTFNL